MSLPVVLLPDAQAEFDDAVDWYEQKTGRGTHFLTRVQEPLERIGTNPALHQIVFRDVRRAVVRRYPYSIFYRVEPARVLVISVFHGRRDPSIWQSRV